MSSSKKKWNQRHGFEEKNSTEKERERRENSNLSLLCLSARAEEIFLFSFYDWQEKKGKLNDLFLGRRGSKPQRCWSRPMPCLFSPLSLPLVFSSSSSNRIVINVVHSLLMTISIGRLQKLNESSRIEKTTKGLCLWSNHSKSNLIRRNLYSSYDETTTKDRLFVRSFTFPSSNEDKHIELECQWRNSMDESNPNNGWAMCSSWALHLRQRSVLNHWRRSFDDWFASTAKHKKRTRAKIAFADVEPGNKRWWWGKEESN